MEQVEAVKQEEVMQLAVEEAVWKQQEEENSVVVAH